LHFPRRTTKTKRLPPSSRSHRKGWHVKPPPKSCCRYVCTFTVAFGCHPVAIRPYRTRVRNLPSPYRCLISLTPTPKKRHFDRSAQRGAEKSASLPHPHPSPDKLLPFLLSTPRRSAVTAYPTEFSNIIPPTPPQSHTPSASGTA
jgi:hypothetical protein